MDVKLYAGDSSHGAYTRLQGQESIACSDPKTDSMVAVSYDDFVKIIKTYESACVMWEDGARAIEKKLRQCGLLTNSNIQKVNNCLESK